MTSRHRGYIVSGKGVYNMICDVCGWKYKNTELKKRWDGLMVCDEDWEARNILDFYKPPKDTFPNPVSRPDNQVERGRVRANLTLGIVSPTKNAFTTLIFDTEVSDTASEFNLGTSTFTVGTTGNYVITAACKYNLTSVKNLYGLAIYKNGSELKAWGPYTNETPSLQYLQGAYRAALVSTDTITIRYYISGTTSNLPAAEEATFVNINLET